MLEKRLKQYMKPGEEPIIILREYSITKLPKFALLAAAYLAVFFFMVPLFSAGIIGVLVFFVALLVVIWFILKAAIIWYFDMCIITEDRIIDVHRNGIFAKHIQEIPWRNVRDIRYSQSGLFAMAFNYGSLELAIQNSEDDLELDHVFAPKRVHDILSDYIERE